MNRLFVGNLPHRVNGKNITEKDLQEFFEDFDVNVSAVQIIRDRATGHSRGFGFVDTEDPLSPIINKTNGVKFETRPLTVNAATEKKRAERSKRYEEKY